MELCFKELRLEDRDTLMPLLRAFRFVDLGFAALYYCAEAFDIRYALTEGALCLRLSYEGMGHVYVTAETDRLSELVPALMEAEGGESVTFDFVERERLDSFSALSGYEYSAGCQEKYSDYFSTVEDYLAVDKRSSLHKYKDYNQFLKRYSSRALPLDSGNLDTARALLGRWCDNRDCAACTSGCEREWILRLLDAWDELPVKGLLVYVDGQPAGFNIAEQNGRVAMRLVGKSAGRQNGLQVFMHIESIRRLFPGVRYVNLGPDSGVEGIRQFKEKFSPYTKLDKYTVTLRRN